MLQMTPSTPEDHRRVERQALYPGTDKILKGRDREFGFRSVASY